MNAIHHNSSFSALDMGSQGMAATEMTDSSEAVSLDMDDALHDAQELLRVAEHIARQACGEEWLLQPFVPAMGRSEYRYVSYPQHMY